MHLAYLAKDCSGQPHIAKHLGFHEVVGGLVEHWGRQEHVKDQQVRADFATKTHGATGSLQR